MNSWLYGRALNYLYKKKTDNKKKYFTYKKEYKNRRIKNFKKVILTRYKFKKNIKCDNLSIWIKAVVNKSINLP